MKLYLTVILFLVFVSLSFGQTPSPTATPENTESKPFGSSLKKYENKDWRDLEENKSDEDEIIRVNTDLVVKDILVKDQRGNLIPNLKKEDFIVTENGEPQAVEVFSIGENASEPRSIVLIIGTHVIWEFPYLKTSIEAAKLLVDKLNPTDKMAILTNGLTLRVDFTNNKTLLKNTLDSIEATDKWSGETFLTLMAVLNEKLKAEDKYPIIIFQGNTNEIIRVKTNDDSFQKLVDSTLAFKVKRYLEFSDIEKTVKKSRARIYSLITEKQFLTLSKKEQEKRARMFLESMSNKFYEYSKSRSVFERNMSLDNKVNRWFQPLEIKRQIAVQESFSRISELSGGFADFIESAEDAEKIYSRIFAASESRYVIGYYPKEQNQGVKNRKVEFKIKNHPEYLIDARNP